MYLCVLSRPFLLPYPLHIFCTPLYLYISFMILLLKKYQPQAPAIWWRLCCCILVTLLICTEPLLAQREVSVRFLNKTDDIEEMIENLVSDLDSEGVDFDTVLELLRDLAEQPLDLNKLTAEELGSSMLLSSQQINSLIAYRDRMGKFTHIYELNAVPGIDKSAAELLSHFVYIPEEQPQEMPLAKLLTRGGHTIFARYQRTLQLADGFKESYEGDSLIAPRFLGNPDRYYLRYRYKLGTKISYGLTAEKDPGEEFFTGSQRRGFDFYSAHFFLRNVGPFKYLALGDYELRFGQGLVVWSGIGLRKGVFMAMDVARQAYPVKQYTSVNENQFFRGGAATFNIANKFDVTAFASYMPLDANVTNFNNEELAANDSTEFETVFAGDGATEASSLQNSGFHRFTNELVDKDAINLIQTGGNVTYRGKRLQVGLTAMYSKFDTDIQPSNNAAYNHFAFSGNSLFNAGLNYRALVHNVTLFGETAISQNGAISTLNGALLDLDKHLRLSLLHRYYSPDYQSVSANAFAEGSNRALNEEGIFIGAIIKPIPKWTLQGYVDIYRHPWLRNQIDAPSHGQDFNAELVYTPRRRLDMYLRYKDETKKRNSVNNETVGDFLVDHTKRGLRYNLKYSTKTGFRLQTRIEWAWYNNGTDPIEKGIMFFQDVKYTFAKPDISIATRIAFFDTETYNARIYAYENDVLYAFSVPPYFGRGTRFYGVVKYEINRTFSVWLRYAQTNFSDRDSISSGLNEIDGPVRSEVKAMLRVKF